MAWIYKVYIKTDSGNRVTHIDSNAFIKDFEGWILIDEGEEDRHHHAQGNYLQHRLRDDRGIYQYKFENNRVVERTKEEMDADWIEPEEVKPQSEILADLQAENAQLKQDYNVLLECVLEMSAIVYA